MNYLPLTFHYWLLFLHPCEGYAEGVEICGRRLVFGAGKYIYLLAPSDSVKADAI